MVFRASLLVLSCLVMERTANVNGLNLGVIHTDRGVIDMEVHRTHHIAKREINDINVAGFTEEEKMAILNIHNSLRAREDSSNMKRMSWNDDLENFAQTYAEKCIFEHSTNRRNFGGFTYIGENLYAGTGSFGATLPIKLWWNETVFYDFNTMFCQPGQMCGHYTQVVWADSYALGCGVKYCPVLQKASFRQGYNVVCHYGPGGNYVGQRPYKKGAACSQCPDDLKFCVNQLCAYRPQIGSPSTSVHGSISQRISLILVISYIYISSFAIR